MIIDWERTIAVAANIAQIASAVFVAIGGILIIQQLRQIKTEETHKKWEALQWALDLITPDDIWSIESFLHKINPTQKELDEIGELILKCNRGIELIGLADSEGYLELELYMLLRADELARLHFTNVTSAQYESSKVKIIQLLLQGEYITHPRIRRVLDEANERSNFKSYSARGRVRPFTD